MIETLARVPARIHPTAFVAAGAVVVGDVALGQRSSVWFNTVVRGDSARIEVGEATNLQDNGVVHVDEGEPAILGARVTVGHRAIIHGCVIEDDCLIGMGSVVLSGARIGRGSLIGAASLVREQFVIPPGSLAFGSPARVVGTVGPDHVEAIRRGASHYAELAQIYLDMGLGRTADPMGVVAGGPAPMSVGEWEHRIAALESAPKALAIRVSRQPSERSSGSIARLATRDRERQSLLVRLLAGERVELPTRADDRAGGEAGAASAGSLAAWIDERLTLCRTLLPLGVADWRRVVGVPGRGPISLFELVREWVDEDLRLCRDLEAAMPGPMS